MSNYGFFDDANKEYVVTTPKTPVKWINYVGTLNFGGFIDCTGGALICKRDPALNRITKYIAQMPQSDFKGTTLYVRVKAVTVLQFFFLNADVKTARLFRMPCWVELFTLVVEAYGVRVNLTAFVPEGREVLLQDIQIENISDDNLEVDLSFLLQSSHTLMP